MLSAERRSPYMKRFIPVTLIWAISLPAIAAGFQTANPAGPVRLQGIFRAAARNGFDSTSALDIFDPARNTPQFNFLTFFQDGRVKKGLVTGGLDEYIAESHMRHDIASGGNTAAQWGVYQIVGGRGVIVFADPRAAGQQLITGLHGEVWPIVVYSDGLDILGDAYLPLYGGNGMHLAGVYKPFGDTKQPGIAFGPDGQFVDQGILNSGLPMALGLSGGGVTATYGITPPGPGRGMYNIAPYSLHLSYTNSKSPSALFFLEPGQTIDKVQILYINNVKYLLQQ
jgi:hypothetical protein